MSLLLICVFQQSLATNGQHMDILLYHYEQSSSFFQMFYGKWQQLGNSTRILQLEIQLDHLTNFESTVNGNA